MPAAKLGWGKAFQGKTIAPKRGSYGSLSAVCLSKIIYDLRLVLSLTVHVRENLDGGHFGSVTPEAKDRNYRYDNYEKIGTKYLIDLVDRLANHGY